MRRQDVTSSVGPPDASPDTVNRTQADPANAAQPPAATPLETTSTSQQPAARWRVLLAWSLGPAALYTLLSLAHAALIERNLSVDVGFGRSLAFWVGSVYLALLGWGFVPAHPTGRYAHRRVVFAMLAVGVIGLLVCGGFTGFWLAGHWVSAVGGPVTVSAVVLVVAAVGVLWLAGREERQAAPPA